MLISLILILIGMLSLAALFHIGLFNAARALRITRGAELARSAEHEISNRQLLARDALLQPANNPTFDPFVHDPGTNPPLDLAQVLAQLGLGPGSPLVGLPVAIDPHGILRGMPDRLGAHPGGNPGMQRINYAFIEAIRANVSQAAAEAAADAIFTSPDDLVFDENNPTVPVIDPIGPDRVGGTGDEGLPDRARNYSWLMTAQPTGIAPGGGRRFEVAIATFFNRSFRGEHVVRAAYLPDERGRPSNQVILRWDPSSGETAPTLPSQGWILDATYDPSVPTLRAYWYHLVDRGEPRLDQASGEMRMLLTLDGPVRELTDLDANTPLPEPLPAGLLDVLGIDLSLARDNYAVIVPGVATVHTIHVTAQ